MNTYCISYVSNSGLACLNDIVEAESRQLAKESIIGYEGITIILSCVKIK